MRIVHFSLRRQIAIALSICLILVSIGGFSVSTVRAETNLIKNCDFSAGFDNWTTTKVTVRLVGQNEFPIFDVLTDLGMCTPSQRKGNDFASINVPFGADGYIEQYVHLPRSGTRLSLLSWGWEGYNPQVKANGLVLVTLSIIDSTGNEHNLATYNPPTMLIPGGGITPDVCTRNAPILLSYDLSAYSDQTVRLRLRATSENCCGTFALFDDLVIPQTSLLSDTGTWVVSNVLIPLLTLQGWVSGAIVLTSVASAMTYWKRYRKKVKESKIIRGTARG